MGTVRSNRDKLGFLKMNAIKLIKVLFSVRQKTACCLQVQFLLDMHKRQNDSFINYMSVPGYHLPPFN